MNRIKVKIKRIRINKKVKVIVIGYYSNSEV